MDIEHRALLWLSSAEISAGRVYELIEQFGSAAEIWKVFETDRCPFFLKGSREKLASLHTDQAIDELLETLTAKNVHLLFRDDPDYPVPLEQISDPPYLLYYAGHLECLRMPMIAIVGTRKASTYGREMSGLIAKGLIRHEVCVVSGLARGIDEAAHSAVLRTDGCTVGILGSGINNPYPPEHRDLLRRIAGGKGLIISEFPLDAKPLKYHFPFRNRVISGLCLATVFVEGRIKSGGMITVSTALAQGREVFAVPGHVGTEGGEGPNSIIREGARLVTCADDILEDLGLKPVSAEESRNPCENLTGTQLKIAQALYVEPMTAFTLSDVTSLSADVILEELSILEINGIVLREAGGLYSLILK